MYSGVYVTKVISKGWKNAVAHARRATKNLVCAN